MGIYTEKIIRSQRKVYIPADMGLYPEKAIKGQGKSEMCLFPGKVRKGQSKAAIQEKNRYGLLYIIGQRLVSTDIIHSRPEMDYYKKKEMGS